MIEYALLLLFGVVTAVMLMPDLSSLFVAWADKVNGWLRLAAG